MRLCAGTVGWILQNEGNWGFGNGGAGVCWRTVEDGWWFFAIACVEICWRWIHWQRGVGCVGSQGSYLTVREPPWEQNGLLPIVNINSRGWGEHLNSPPSWLAAWLFAKLVCPVYLVDRCSSISRHGGAVKSILYSYWKGEYVQGQSWTVVQIPHC